MDLIKQHWFIIINFPAPAEKSLSQGEMEKINAECGNVRTEQLSDFWNAFSFYKYLRFKNQNSSDIFHVIQTLGWMTKPILPTELCLED